MKTAIQKAAHHAVANEVRQGRLPKARDVACVDCGKTACDYDHAWGYERANWLRVEAVCKPCHGRRGALRGETAHGDRNGTRTCPESVRRGEANGKSVLTATIVREIRRLAASGLSVYAIAKNYGIGWTTADSVVKGRSWRHVS